MFSVLNTTVSLDVKPTQMPVENWKSITSPHDWLSLTQLGEYARGKTRICECISTSPKPTSTQWCSSRSKLGFRSFPAQDCKLCKWPITWLKRVRYYVMISSAKWAWAYWGTMQFWLQVLFIAKLLKSLFWYILKDTIYTDLIMTHVEMYNSRSNLLKKKVMT